MKSWGTPKLAERLLRLCLPREDRDVVLAELAELYQVRSSKARRASQRFWYWIQLVSFLSRMCYQWLARILHLRSASRISVRPGRNSRRPQKGERLFRLERFVEFLHSVVEDLRFSFRSLRRSRTLIGAAVLTLALGIGANSIVFSVVDVLMLHPLPYENSDRLVSVFGSSENLGVTHAGQSLPDYLDLREQSTTLDVVGWYPMRFNLSGGETPERVSALRVSWNFFRVLGVHPKLGREFSRDEEIAGRHHVAIIGEGLSNRLFAGDSSVLGETLRLDGKSYTVVGVMPNEFVFAHNNAQLWTPIGIDGREERADRSLEVFGRLHADASVEQARAEVNQIGAGLADRYPDTNAGWSADIRSLRDSLFPEIVRPVSIILMVAVGSVLLIACANVANLMLTRGDARAREIAVRSVLGAKRLRIVRQMLTEATLVSLIGGFLGLVVASVGIRGVLAVVMPEPVPGIGAVEINSRVLTFTIAVTALTGVLFGIGPAMRCSRAYMSESIKTGRTSTAEVGGDRVRRVLVVSQISLALALLVASALQIKAFMRLQTMELGFDRENLFTFSTTLPQSDYSEPAAIAEFQQALLGRLSAIPNVESVGGVDLLPLVGFDQTSYSVPGKDLPSDRFEALVSHRAVLPGYFHTLRIEVLSGRIFSRDDSPDAAAVAVVNEAFAERHWRGESPIGSQIRFNDRIHEIVGVVENSANQFGTRSEPMVFWPALQTPMPNMTFVARAFGEHSNLLDVVRSEVRSLDPNLPVYDVRMMDDLLDAAFLEVGVVVSLMILTAAIAVALAQVGVFGVVSYSVARRTHELGIRMALGAGQKAVLGLIVRQGMRLAVAGMVLGLTLAVLLAQGMAGLLFGLNPTDPSVFIGVVIALSLTCLAATSLPARRATLVDPLEAIRYE
jgi:predicted permease